MAQTFDQNFAIGKICRSRFGAARKGSESLLSILFEAKEAQPMPFNLTVQLRLRLFNLGLQLVFRNRHIVVMVKGIYE